MQPVWVARKKEVQISGLFLPELQETHEKTEADYLKTKQKKANRRNYLP